MKLTKLLMIPILASTVSLFSSGLLTAGGKTPSDTLTVTCSNPQPDGSCPVGSILDFSGTGYNHMVHVVITGPGFIQDDTFYTTSHGGDLSFQETCTLSGTYTIDVYDVSQGGRTETQTVFGQTFDVPLL